METGSGRNGMVGLILAAGYSSRMGAFKPLLPIGDMNAIQRISTSLKGAGIYNMIGVTGFQRERLAPVFAEEGIAEAYNPDFDKGMFSSVRTGIAKAMEKNPEGFFLMLADCPLVPPEVIEQIAEKHREQRDAFILPCYRGKNGHPLFIPAIYAEEILAYEGDGGLKAVRTRHEDKLIRLEVDTEAVVLDMDTPQGYEELLEYYRRQRGARASVQETAAGGSQAVDQWEADLEEILRDGRLFLVRHGEIRQHKEKIFLGQTDVPLSPRGREQAKEAAAVLARFGASANRIYTSDLSRAAETAEIIGGRLGLEVIPIPKLREMALGEWDGKYVSEIRERHPEEYQKRGANLLTYKFGHESENFYDLQYRVMKGLEEVLKREKERGGMGKDIVITAHHGVIHGILGSLCRSPLEEEMKRTIPNGGVVLLEDRKKGWRQL